MNQSVDPEKSPILPAKELDAIARDLTDQLLSEIEKQTGQPSRHLQMLEDSRHALVRELAQRLHFGKWNDDAAETQEFLWNLSNRLPSFNLDALYRKRPSLLALAGAVALGWFLGGLASTLLGLLALGGEILRPLAIFFTIWLEEYVSVNPVARKWFLTILGFGGLARFATLAMGGFFRFTGFGALRQAIFGVARPNIFKGFWLMAGAIFVLVFLSRKVTGLDIPAFRQSLEEQIHQRLGLCVFILEKMEEEAKARARLSTEMENGAKKAKASSHHRLVQAISDILPTLNPDARKFIRSTLAENGYELQGDDSGIFIWNSEEHAPLYTTIGIISDGDRARILDEPYVADGKTIKGHAQKIQE